MLNFGGVTASYGFQISESRFFAKKNDLFHQSTTVDERNPAPVGMVNICEYPILLEGFYIPGGAGFLP